jgi:hypothetical protein
MGTRHFSFTVIEDVSTHDTLFWLGWGLTNLERCNSRYLYNLATLVSTLDVGLEVCTPLLVIGLFRLCKNTPDHTHPRCFKTAPLLIYL